MKLALLVAAWLAGIFLGFRVDAGMAPVALLLFAALPTGVLLRLLGWSLWPVLLIVILLAGLLRIEAFEVLDNPLAVQESEPVTLRGRIANHPEATERLVKFMCPWRRLTGRGRLLVLMPRPWFAQVHLRP